MNKKAKIILIALEVFILVVLVLVALGYQQKWIIQTDDGPRFDWYEIQEDLTIDIQDIIKPNKKPKDENEPETPSESESTDRPATNDPSQSATPEPDAEEPTTDPAETTAPSTQPPTDNWETDEF